MGGLPICLLFGLSETAALDLHIGTPPPTCDADQWFDPTTGSHVWNHHVYLVGDDGRSNKDLLNYIPVPQALAEAIQQFAGPHMDGKQIKHILFPNTTFDATAFGRYLAAISSPAHPVTAARLSQSFGNAFLQCTQSDLAAAFCSLRLSLVGLASLYYFSPSREWVHQKCTEVFHELGLGAPVQFIGNNFRMGARSLPLDLTHIHKAWNQIEEIFLRAYRDVLRWASRDDAVEAFNSLSVLAATVLVASIGGRTSRPDRMLVSHLYSNDSFYAFSDKEVKETGLWRLIPHTQFSLALLKLYRHARSYLIGRAGLESEHATNEAFVSIDPANFTIKAISAQSISSCIHEFFGGIQANYFRHLFITTWVEAGRSRWLLRCWTGHGRAGVMPFDASMAVAPREAMETLATELNDHIGKTLGPWPRVNKLARQIAATKSAQFASPRYEWIDVSGHGAKLNDDGWPEKFSPRLVADWELVNRIRQRIVLAEFEDHHVGFTVSKLAIDGMPLTLVMECRKAVSLGKTEGELWVRDHDVHPAFMAYLPPTRLIGSQPSKKVTCETLVRDVAIWLRKTDRTSGWPTEDQLCLKRFESACKSWRRIELPPPLALSASPAFESCTASLHSLTRLSGNEDKASRLSSVDLVLPDLPSSVRLKIHNLSVLNPILNRCSDRNTELGQDAARARELVRSLDGLARGTYVFELAKQYLLWEANAVLERAPYKNAISSLATRWTALRPALDKLDLFTSSDDLDDGLIRQITEEVFRVCVERRGKKGLSNSELGAGQLRARDALQRFFKMLQSSGTSIPPECWARLGNSESPAKRRSAGSSLVFNANVERLMENINKTFADRNLEQKFLLTKVCISDDVPSRSGEVGSTFRNCLTLSGDFTFMPTAFSTDKTKHASRQVEIRANTREQIESLAKIGEAIRPDGRHLFRFDEHAKAFDFAANQFIEDELKHQTQDEFCRLHSLRARAYCNRAWPGWEEVARSFFTGDLTPEEARRWTQSIPVNERWTKLINVAVAAGHGSIDAGLKSYLSIWNLLYSIYLYATLSSIKPVNALWLDCAKVKFEAMRKAMYRSKSSGLDNGWLYLVNRLDSSHAEPALRHVELLPHRAPSKPKKQEPIDAVSRLQYVMLRMLAMEPDKARHELKLPMDIEGWAAVLLPSFDKVEESRKRKRTEPGSIGLSGEIKLLLSETGAALTNWISSLTPAQCEWLQVLLMRWDQRLPGRLETVWDPNFWQDLGSGMAADICLHVRFGKGAHLPIDVETNFKQEQKGFKLGERMEGLGKMPYVSVQLANIENRSVQARLTALTKIGVMARLAIEHAASQQEARHD